MMFQIKGFEDLIASERAHYHSLALSELLSHCATHPLTTHRIRSLLASEITPENALSLLSEVTAETIPDHRHAIGQPSSLERQPADFHEARIVFSTSGTSGRQKLLINRYDEMLVNAEFHGAAYRTAGIRPEDVVATFGGHGTFASEYCVYHALAHTGCTIVPINDFRNTEENVRLISDLGVTVLLTMPSETFSLVKHLEEGKAKLPKVRLIVTGGERLSSQLRARLITVTSDAVMFGSTFQAADLGTIGFQCSDCERDQYHLQETLQFVELLPDLDGGGDAGGELVASNLHRRSMPILRIRSGDRAQWESQPCRCGRHARKIKLLGRGKEMIKVGGEKIDGTIFVSLAEKAGLSEPDLRVVITTEDNGKDKITVQTRKPLPPETSGKVVKAILVDPKLAQLMIETRIEKIAFAGLDEAHVSGSLNAKHQPLVDRRYS